MTPEAIGDLMVAAILADPTIAGTNIYAARDWPTWIDTMPIVLFDVADDDMTSMGRSAPQYTSISRIPLTARVTAPSGDNDAGAGVVRYALGLMREKIKRAVINYTPLMTQIQQITQINSQMKSGASESRQHVGELTMLFSVEHYRGTEDFNDVSGVSLNEIDISFLLKNAQDSSMSFAGGSLPIS